MQRLSFFWGILGTGMAALLSPAATAQTVTPVQWAQDVKLIEHRLSSLHPSPARRVGWEQWLNALKSIPSDAAEDDPARTATRLMQLIASLGDTHTGLLPSATVGFDRWFPLRIYEFTDGYFITAIDRRHADLVAAKVLTVNGMPIDEAARKARSLVSSENEFGRREAIYYLSSPPALAALGVIEDPARMTLELIDRGGKPRRLELAAVQGEASMAWVQWGEMFGPLFEDPRRLVTAFNDLSPLDYRSTDEARPLHLRHRGRYAFWHLEDRGTIYAQINFLIDSDESPFETGFMRELFDAVDDTGAERLIIDLRYNGGGDGSMAIPFVHELIKRDHSVNQPGRLFVLIGRKTFSAAVTLLDQITDHTAAMLVGEPPRSPFNHFGDPTSTTLQHSGMRLDVSNRYWQFSTSDDTRSAIPVHYPAPFSSVDYFSGRDPALQAIFSGRVQPLPDLIRAEGAAAANAILEAAIEEHGQPDWWVPFERRAMRHAGRDLIRAGRLADGLAAYRLNTRFHGESWRVWDSLGDGLTAAGYTVDAISAYHKALSLKPDNWNSRHQRDMIEKLTAEVTGDEEP